jgi:AcrR family transcriptional regulator
MSKTLERHAKLRDALILAAERSIAAGGLGALKTRELAREIGCANGAVYNLVEDMDELILRVGSRTLGRLDAFLTDAESESSASPRERLVRIAIAYCDFAAQNFELWRALFEHRMQRGKPTPDWAIGEQMELFRHIYRPLATLFPKRSPQEISVTARSLFSPRTKADRGAARRVANRDFDHRESDRQRARARSRVNPMRSYRSFSLPLKFQ